MDLPRYVYRYRITEPVPISCDGRRTIKISMAPVHDSRPDVLGAPWAGTQEGRAGAATQHKLQGWTSRLLTVCISGRSSSDRFEEAKS